MGSILDTINKLSYIFVGIFLFLAAIVGVQYLSGPQHIKDPSVEHYHIRTQIIANGELVDFSNPAFQEAYEAGQCTDELPETPIHFHDNIDQMTHIHWNGIRGGDILKYYGWNLIGGSDNSLGKRFDRQLWGEPVSVHGKVLPELPNDISFYIYTGDEKEYVQRSWTYFLEQDLEVFFGETSNLKDEQSTFSAIIGLLANKAHAHSDDELKQINNLIGNVVIFAQANEPTAGEITERFNNLEPLKDSTCGG